MQFKRHIVVSLVCLFVVNIAFGNLPTTTVVVNAKQAIFNIDSSSILLVTPSKKKEINLFSDSKLKYQQIVTAQKGFFERLLEWLAEKLFRNAGYDNILTTRKLIVGTICVVAIALLIWLLSRSEFVSLIKPKPKSTSFNFTDLVEDLDKINFEHQINSAIADENYRLATRWNYLKILFLLDKNKLILFASHKTNIDYKYELKDKKLQTDFTRLSYIYDYVWYGKFEITALDYHEQVSDFINFESTMHV